MFIRHVFVVQEETHIFIEIEELIKNIVVAICYVALWKATKVSNSIDSETDFVLI